MVGWWKMIVESLIHICFLLRLRLFPSITVAIPVSVALGICGRSLISLVSYRSGSGRRRQNLLPFSLGECLCYLCIGGFAGLGTKRDRKVETDTMRTTMLHSCCN